MGGPRWDRVGLVFFFARSRQHMQTRPGALYKKCTIHGRRKKARARALVSTRDRRGRPTHTYKQDTCMHNNYTDTCWGQWLRAEVDTRDRGVAVRWAGGCDGWWAPSATRVGHEANCRSPPIPNNLRSGSESKAIVGSLGRSVVDRLAQPEGKGWLGGQAWPELDACEVLEKPVSAEISASLETW